MSNSKSQTSSWAREKKLRYAGVFLTEESYKEIEDLQIKYARPKTWVLQRVISRGLALPAAEELLP